MNYIDHFLLLYFPIGSHISYYLQRVRVFRDKFRYSLAGQDARLSPERPGLKSRWRLAAITSAHCDSSVRALERQDHTASVAKSPVYVIENSKPQHRLYASVAESQPIMPVLFWGKGVVTQWIRSLRTVWPSGLRRWLQAPVRKGVGSNPGAVIFG